MVKMDDAALNLEMNCKRAEIMEITRKYEKKWVNSNKRRRSKSRKLYTKIQV